MANVLAELGAKATEAVTNIEGWFGELKQHVPAMAAEAAKYAGNPLLDAIVESELHIPAKYVTIALDFLNKLATIDETPDVAAPAADTTAAPDPAASQVAS